MPHIKVNIKNFISNPQFIGFLTDNKIVVNMNFEQGILGHKYIALDKILLLFKNNSEFQDLFLDVDVKIDLSILMAYPKLLGEMIKKYKQSHLFSNIFDTMDVIGIYNKSPIKNAEVRQLINENILNAVCKLKCSYQYGYFPRLLNKASNIFTQETKSNLFKFFLNNHTKFASVKKQCLEIIAKYVSSYDEKIKFLYEFHRSLNNKMFLNIVSLLPLGMKDKNVVAVLNKNNKLSICRFSQKDMEDPKKRKALVHHIVKTPTSAKNINFNITITYKDLKKVAPVMRFKFLNWYFDSVFEFIRSRKMYYSYLTLTLEDLEKRCKIKNLKIEYISYEKIKSLLFSVGIKKNSEVSKWLGKYSVYCDVMEHRAVPEPPELRKIWGLRY
jgi:hypothetical protein